jgi:uncharacterized radical SAM superfamily Fe-S cluster-containing enzyme
LDASNKIRPLPSQSDSPIEGEDVLASMLQWHDRGEPRPGNLAGLVELNWAWKDDPGLVYDRVVGRQQRPLSSLTVEQATEMLSALEEQDMALEMIYFAGEDPAGHPQLGDFVELARQKGISRVGLQCSGLRIANDDHLLDTLARLRPWLFVEFDGFDETTSLILHGRRDLPFAARRGLDRLAAIGLPAALLASVAQGVNLHEVGAIASFGLNHPAVFSAIFRPVPTRLNRLGPGPSGHLTAASIMVALEQQSHGFFRQGAFTPALCCRPERHFYAQVPYAGSNATLTRQPNEAPCPAMSEGEPSFWLGVHEFMTPWSKDIRQAQHCPLVVMTPDRRPIPYCLYNAQEEPLPGP